MDLRLSSEFSFDRMHRQAVTFHAAVTAPLADGFVDVDAHRRVRQLAPLAEPALLRRAALVVDQDRDAGNLAEDALGLVEAVAVPDLHAPGPAGPLGGLVELVGHHDDALDALRFQRPRQLGHGHRAGGVLAAGPG